MYINTVNTPLLESPNMIDILTINTNQETLQKLVEIHKRCISETNAKYYQNQQIQEWLSLINVKNIKDQLENTSWIIIRNGDAIVGFAQYSIEEKELYQIQVDPEVQGGGYGKELYEYIEKDFKQNDITQISLFSTLNAVGFYEKLGFKTVKKIKFPLIETKVNMVEMIKKIS